MQANYALAKRGKVMRETNVRDNGTVPQATSFNGSGTRVNMQ